MSRVKMGWGKRCITIDDGVVVSDKREEDYHETK